MHELSIAQDLLEKIEEEVGPGDLRIMRIELSIGSAAGIVLESLRFAFEVAAAGTRAQGAELAIATEPARSRCIVCGILYVFEGLIGNCPRCGRLGGEMLSGDELILRSIEVADV